MPPIPGLTECPFWTSSDALSSEFIPDRLGIIGSSTVVADLALAFARLGSHVTILARRALLVREDPAIGTVLTAGFRAEGIAVLAHIEARRCDHRNNTFIVATSGATQYFDKLLVATGREPNTGMLVESRRRRGSRERRWRDRS